MIKIVREIPNVSDFDNYVQKRSMYSKIEISRFTYKDKPHEDWWIEGIMRETRILISLWSLTGPTRDQISREQIMRAIDALVGIQMAEDFSSFIIKGDEPHYSGSGERCLTLVPPKNHWIWTG